jgi:hypothetical protein
MCHSAHDLSGGSSVGLVGVGQGRKALFYTTTYVLYTLPEGMVVGLVAYGQVVGERREVIIDQCRTGLLYILLCDV